MDSNTIGNTNISTYTNKSSYRFDLESKVAQLNNTLDTRIVR